MREFLESHPRLFVVEQNRDAQLRSLLAIETGVARDRMTAVLDYGGLPLTARTVVDAILGDMPASPAPLGMTAGISPQYVHAEAEP